MVVEKCCRLQVTGYWFDAHTLNLQYGAMQLATGRSPKTYNNFYIFEPKNYTTTDFVS